MSRRSSYCWSDPTSTGESTLGGELAEAGLGQPGLIVSAEDVERSGGEGRVLVDDSIEGSELFVVGSAGDPVGLAVIGDRLLENGAWPEPG